MTDAISERSESAASDRLPAICYVDGHDHWLPGLLSDRQIKHLAEKHGMITPFEPKAVRKLANGTSVLSFGLGSYGYDFRVQPKWKVFTPTGGAHIIDPKNMDMTAFVEREGESIVIPANGFVLASSVERFVIPDDVMCIVFTKSTYARCGIAMQLTPLEAGWTGYVTVEIGNTTPHQSRVYANEGMGQVLFIKGSEPCLKSYANKNEGGAAGKYQDQPNAVVFPKL